MAVARAVRRRELHRGRWNTPPAASPKHVLSLGRRSLARGRRAPRPVRAVALARRRAVREDAAERTQRTRSLRADQAQDREHPRGAQGDRPHRTREFSLRPGSTATTTTPINAGAGRPARERHPRVRDASAPSRTRPSSSSSTSSRSRTTRTLRSPVRWLRFLDELWGEDEESKHHTGGVVRLRPLERRPTLPEDVSPRRAEAVGQGTIARVLTGLLGAHNVAAPTLAEPDAELRPPAADRKAAGDHF